MAAEINTKTEKLARIFGETIGEKRDRETRENAIKDRKDRQRKVSNVTVMPSRQSEAVPHLLGGGKVELRRDETRDN